MKAITTLILVMIGSFIYGQVKFHQTYDLTSSDKGFDIRQTSDGGYIITGSTTPGSDKDIILIKTDSDGDTSWIKTFGGSDDDVGKAVRQTADGGYIIAGYTKSYGAGLEDAYLIKTDASGNSQWTQTYGHAELDIAEDVQQTDDGGYILTGISYFGPRGNDIYLVKTKANGDTTWTETYGGTQFDEGYSVMQTFDGGYMIIGSSFSFGAGDYDLYMLKTDASGQASWTKTYGGTARDEGFAGMQTDDGGYIVAGFTKSQGNGIEDVYLIKTDVSGNEIWSKTYGGTNLDIARSVFRTADRGYIVAGSSKSFGTVENYYLIKTDSNGGTEWQKNYSYSPSTDDQAHSVIQASDGGFIMAGFTTSTSFENIYIVKTLTNGCAIRKPNIIVNTNSNQANTICQGESVILELDREYTVYSWSTTETTATINIGDVGGTYSVDVEDEYGCTESSDALTLTQLTMPSVTVTPNGPTMYCPGSFSNVTLQTIPATYPSYLWNTGETTPDIVVDKLGDYFVIVTAANGCKNIPDTTTIANYEPYSEDHICLVTIDTIQNKNIVIWERTEGKRTAYYNIYKESSQTGVWDNIGSVPFDSLSVFVDITSKPRNKAARYKITAVDSCGTESSYSPIHETMFLQVNEGIGVLNLDWSPYQGFIPTSYVIYRGTSVQNMVELDAVSASLTKYTDTDPPSGLVFYRVGIVLPSECSPATTRGVSSSGPYSQSLSNLKDYSMNPTGYLQVGPTTQYMKKTKDTIFFEVYTSLPSWDATTNENWLTLYPNLNDNILTVIANTELTEGSRSAEITITGDGVDPQTVYAIQVISGIHNNEDISSMLSIFPNPYQNRTNIAYELEASSFVNIEVYNLIGEKVSTLVNKLQAPGEYSLSFSAGDLGYPDGLYLLKFSIGNNSTIKKLIELQ